MTRTPTYLRVAPCSPPSSTLRAGFAGGLRPCLTATARAAWETSGRDEETALVSRTKKQAGNGTRNDRGSVSRVVRGSIPDVAGQLLARVHAEIDLGRADVGVPEPERHLADVAGGLQHDHRAAVPELVRRDGSAD